MGTIWHAFNTAHTDGFATCALVYGLAYGYVLRMVYCKLFYGDV